VIISKTEAVFLGIGLVIHAGFIAAAQRVPAPVYHYDEPEPAAYVEIITPDKEEPKPIEERVRPEEEVATNTGSHEHRGSDPSRASQAPRASAAGNENPDQQSSENLVPESPKRADEVPHDEFDEPMADNKRHIPGVDSPVWDMPDVIDKSGHGPAAPTEAPKAKKVAVDQANRVLGDALDKRDKDLGLQLAAAGTVSSTVKASVMGSAIPWDARGTIIVTVDASGTVTGVKVAAAAGGAASDWDAAAANIKASLAGRKLQLTEKYKNGAIIAVNVLSKRQLPSGVDPSSPIHLGTTSTFDVSDIGAKPIHQVQASFSVTPIK